MRTLSMIRPVAGLFVVTGLVFGLTACGSAEVEIPTEEPVEEPEEEPEPEPEPEPAPKGAGMTVDELNTNRADHVGKQVKVSGFYMSTTKQGNPVEQINISVQATAEEPEGDEAPQKLLCVAKPENEAMFDGLTQKSEIIVVGMVEEKDFFGGAMLSDCTIGKAGGGGGGGKGGGAGAGGDGEKKGKTKGKGGKNKAH